MVDKIGIDECADRPIRQLQGVNAEAMSDAVFAINTLINHSTVLNLLDQSELLSLVRAVQKLPPL